MSAETLYVTRLTSEARIPARATPQSAGVDVCSIENAVVPSGSWKCIGTGLTMAVPESCYARIAPRSGLSVKHGIMVGAGVVDADYRGEVKVLLFNHGPDNFHVAKGDRIAQVILERVSMADVVEVEKDHLSHTTRGSGGFGSTGK